MNTTTDTTTEQIDAVIAVGIIMRLQAHRQRRERVAVADRQLEAAALATLSHRYPTLFSALAQAIRRERDVVGEPEPGRQPSAVDMHVADELERIGAAVMLVVERVSGRLEAEHTEACAKALVFLSAGHPLLALAAIRTGGAAHQAPN